MYERVRPVRLAAFIGIAGLVVAAELGDVSAACCSRSSPFLPVLFLLALAMPDARADRRSAAIARPCSASYWIGLGARARGPAARLAARRRRSWSTCCVGTFIGRHRRLPRRPRVRHAAAGAADLAEQDGRGAWSSGCSSAIARRLVRRARTRTGWIAAGRRCCSASRSAIAAPIGDLFESLIKRDAGTKDTGDAVRRPRRRAGPARRRAVRAGRRLLRLAGAADMSRRRGEARPPDDRAAQRAARRAARRADPVRVPAHRAVHAALRRS